MKKMSILLLAALLAIALPLAGFAEDEDAIRALRQQLEEQLDKIDELTDALDKANARAAALEEALARATEREAEARTEAEALRAEKAALESDARASEQREAALAENLLAAETREAEALSALDALRAEGEDMKKTMETENARLQIACAAYDAMRARLDEADARAARFAGDDLSFALPSGFRAMQFGDAVYLSSFDGSMLGVIREITAQEGARVDDLAAYALQTVLERLGLAGDDGPTVTRGELAGGTAMRFTAYMTYEDGREGASQIAVIELDGRVFLLELESARAIRLLASRAADALLSDMRMTSEEGA